MNEMDTRFANQYNIQWFPGHMTKTLRMMEQEIQHVDASLVLLDARIPLSSLNPEIERITARKPKLYALNKADLADPAVTEEWIRYFRAADAGCVAISAKQKGGTTAVKNAIEKELSGLLERRQNRGMSGAKTQVMLCGIPNVGKSTFINTFAGSARAKAADLQAQIDAATKERTALAATLPADVLTDYERLLKQFRGLAVEPIQGNIPTVCHTALQASSMSDLNHDGSEITHCPYCHRLLVLPSKEA